MGSKFHNQLCWSCIKACDGNLCPWAKNFTPVKGWKAEPTHKPAYKLDNNEVVYTDSYNIYECPLYVNDDKLKNKPPLILIAGMCASGKDYLVRLLTEKYALNLLKSYTTRPMREPNEQTHTFADLNQFMTDVKQGNVIASTIVNNEIYYATKQQINAADIYIVDLEGIEACKKITNRTIYNILITAKDKTRLQRLNKRLATELQDQNKNLYELTQKYKNRWKEDKKAYAESKVNTIVWEAIIDNTNNNKTAFNNLERVIQRIFRTHKKPLIKL